MPKKTMTFNESIAWIALNDEPTILDADEMEGLISVQLVADIYRKEPKYVATFVVKVREEILKSEADK